MYENNSVIAKYEKELAKDEQYEQMLDAAYKRVIEANQDELYYLANCLWAEATVSNIDYNDLVARIMHEYMYGSNNEN